MKPGTRITRALRSGEIVPEDTPAYNDFELLRIPGLGRRSLKTIRQLYGIYDEDKWNARVGRKTCPHCKGTGWVEENK